MKHTVGRLFHNFHCSFWSQGDNIPHLHTSSKETHTHKPFYTFEKSAKKGIKPGNPFGRGPKSSVSVKRSCRLTIRIFCSFNEVESYTGNWNPGTFCEGLVVFYCWQGREGQ